jgi:hypothetical protein
MSSSGGDVGQPPPRMGGESAYVGQPRPASVEPVGGRIRMVSPEDEEELSRATRAGMFTGLAAVRLHVDKGLVDFR